MSRIGNTPVILPKDATVTVEDMMVNVSGPKGKLKVQIPEKVQVELTDGKVVVKSEQGNLHGLVKTNIANAVKGVTEGWSKSLELSGTGYRAAVVGTGLQFALGFSHQINLPAPEGIAFEAKDNKITVRGADKALVGLLSAKIRGFRPADPYKAKGLKYEGEVIVKKAGKAAKAGGTK